MSRPLFAILVLLGAGGCASLEGDPFAVYDPHENANRQIYRVNDAVDRTLVIPVAKGYQAVTPNWLEQGILNVFENLRTIDSALNGFLQGKVRSGFIDLSRIVINSTVGVGGFFDVASRVDLPHQQEDFGQTLAVWGVQRSRYVYVPLLGPSTWRDLPSTVLRGWIPRLVLGPDYHWALSGLDLISTRADLLGATSVRDASALDPYAFTRDAYYQRRKFLIYDGDLPVDDLFDEFEGLEDGVDF